MYVKRALTLGSERSCKPPDVFNASLIFRFGHGGKNKKKPKKPTDRRVFFKWVFMGAGFFLPTPSEVGFNA